MFNNYHWFMLFFFVLNINAVFSQSFYRVVSNKKVVKEEVYQKVSQTWEVATWKDFSESAISHTWDDNTPNQLTVAMPLYDEFGFKATFFIITRHNPDWQGFARASLNGHEVSSHTLTHPAFSNIPLVEVEHELRTSQLDIIDHIPTSKSLTFAYPFCITDKFDPTNYSYIAARTCSGQVTPSNVVDFMNIGSFICGEATDNQTEASFNRIANLALKEKGWSVYLFHGIDQDYGYSPVASVELKKHLHYLSDNKDKFWLDTFVNVVKYIKERQGIKIDQTGTSPSSITATLTDGLDDAIYDFPITLKKEVPRNWRTISVTQSDKPIDFKIVEEGSKKYVVLNAVPDAGEVRLRRG